MFNLNKENIKTETNLQLYTDMLLIKSKCVASKTADAPAS
jgi:hypothetical protein